MRIPSPEKILTKLSAKEHLKNILDHAAHLLPAQGPIGIFIHHNTLHAYQHLPFESALIEASNRYGTEPYLAEEQYLQELARGRIEIADIDAILNSETDTTIWPDLLTRRRLRRAMLVPGLRYFCAENIEWQIEEHGLLKRLRDDLNEEMRKAILRDHSEAIATRNLFAACFHRVPNEERKKIARISRLRDALFAATAEDIDAAVDPLLIQLCSVYLDQGLAYWPMPDRELGFYIATRELLQQSFVVEAQLLTGLHKEFREQQRLGMNAADVVLHYLDLFGLSEQYWDEIITAELLALPGWAGLMRRMEEQPELAPHEQLPCSLESFVKIFSGDGMRNLKLSPCCQSVFICCQSL